MGSASVHFTAGIGVKQRQRRSRFRRVAGRQEKRRERGDEGTGH